MLFLGNHSWFWPAPQTLSHVMDFSKLIPGDLDSLSLVFANCHGLPCIKKKKTSHSLSPVLKTMCRMSYGTSGIHLRQHIVKILPLWMVCSITHTPIIPERLLSSVEMLQIFHILSPCFHKAPRKWEGSHWLDWARNSLWSFRVHQWFSVLGWCVCMCVCVKEREREREDAQRSLLICVGMRFYEC